MTYPRFHPACGHSPPLLDAVTGVPRPSILICTLQRRTLHATGIASFTNAGTSNARRYILRSIAEQTFRRAARKRWGDPSNARPSQHKGSLSGRQIWKPVFVKAFEFFIIIPRFSKMSRANQGLLMHNIQSMCYNTTDAGCCGSVTFIHKMKKSVCRSGSSAQKTAEKSIKNDRKSKIFQKRHGLFEKKAV